MSIENSIKAIYERAEGFHARLRKVLEGETPGYAILYGPATLHAPVMFIGINPGGDDRVRYGWPPPSECEYASATFRLAQRLQVGFGREFLEKCTGLNCFWLSTQNENAYEGLKQGIAGPIIEEFERFSVSATREIVKILQPRCVVFIGFRSLRYTNNGDLGGEPVMKNGTGHALLVPPQAPISGFPELTYAMWHPTANGPQPNSEDLKRIGEYIIGETNSAS
jgi:hypothetical protein